MSLEELKKALDAKAKREKCERCNGFGWTTIDDQRNTNVCPECKGNGFVEKVSVGDAVALFEAREQALRELFKNRPTHKWMVNNLDKIENVEIWFEKAEKLVFDETFVKSFVVVPRAQLEERIAQLERTINEGRAKVQGKEWVENAAEPATFVHYLQGRKDALEKELLEASDTPSHRLLRTCCGKQYDKNRSSGQHFLSVAEARRKLKEASGGKTKT